VPTAPPPVESAAPAGPTAPAEPIPIVPAPLGRPRTAPPPLADAPAAATPAATPTAAVAAAPPAAPAIADAAGVQPEPIAAIPDIDLAIELEPEGFARPVEQEPQPAFEPLTQAAALPDAAAIGSRPAAPSSSIAPAAELAADSQIGPRWRQPGQTAPEELLHAPASAGVAADGFFSGLIHRVEGDR